MCLSVSLTRNLYTHQADNIIHVSNESNVMSCYDIILIHGLDFFLITLFPRINKRDYFLFVKNGNKDVVCG